LVPKKSQKYVPILLDPNRGQDFDRIPHLFQKKDAGGLEQIVCLIGLFHLFEMLFIGFLLATRLSFMRLIGYCFYFNVVDVGQVLAEAHKDD